MYSFLLKFKILLKKTLQLLANIFLIKKYHLSLIYNQKKFHCGKRFKNKLFQLLLKHYVKSIILLFGNLLFGHNRVIFGKSKFQRLKYRFSSPTFIKKCFFYFEFEIFTFSLAVLVSWNLFPLCGTSSDARAAGGIHNLLIELFSPHKIPPPPTSTLEGGGGEIFLKFRKFQHDLILSF